MSISFISTAVSSATTLALPAHQAGDVIVLLAYNSLSSTYPTIPIASGTVPAWSNVTNNTSGTSAGRLLYAVASSSSHTSGTWTNATRLLAVVYRGASRISQGSVATGSGTSLFHPSLTPSEGAAGNNIDAVLRVSAHKSATNLSQSVTGYTFRNGTSSSTGSTALRDQVQSTSSLPSLSLSVNASNSYIAFTAILRDNNRRLIADTRNYVAAGANAVVFRPLPPFPVDSSTYALLGGVTEFSPGVFFDGAAGVFACTGSDATLRYNQNLLHATRQRYQAEGPAAVLNFTRRIYADGGVFGLSGGVVTYPRGYYLDPLSVPYNVVAPEAFLKASLRFILLRGAFSVTGRSNAFYRGYIINSSPGAFAATWYVSQLYLYARVVGVSASYEANWPDTPLKRALIGLISSGTFTWTLNQSGFQFTPPAPASGQPRPRALNPYGGSDDTGGSFVRPQYVKYNSASKAKDFGIVSNLFSIAEGELGGQAGSNTAFYKVETDGPAQLFIQNNTDSAFTKNYISVGVLDSTRKPLSLTPQGFAYLNDNAATPALESAESLPPGIYYFTISCNQWQAIPFTVTMQVIRFKPLIGAAGGTFAPYGRFAQAKLFSVATLTAPFTGTIPPDSAIDRLSGVATVTATPLLSLAIMRGAAVGTMVPYGRLKQTHRISGTAIGNGNSIATLSSIPPYGGGYGGGY